MRAITRLKHCNVSVWDHDWLILLVRVTKIIIKGNSCCHLAVWVLVVSSKQRNTVFICGLGLKREYSREALRVVLRFP